MKNKFILWFKEVGIKDIPLVGGKNAALGEMFSNLTKLGIQVPNGFAITSYAYQYFLQTTGVKKEIKNALTGLDTKNIKDLQARGKAVRHLIVSAKLPQELIESITSAYRGLEEIYGKTPDVAVRSSATAEDLPDASFAGQQETYLNVVGIQNVVYAVKLCIASLFTDRAISYREDKGFSHFKVALSVGIQKMVRSDVGSSGVMFTIDTETGFPNVVVINAIYGLGEMIVKGKVTPDEFLVFKPSLQVGYKAIIAKHLGRKNLKLVYGKQGTKETKVQNKLEANYSLTDAEIRKLAKWGIQIEEYFSKKHKHLQPMDIEWAKDGKTGKIYIVQARPETIHSTEDKRVLRSYQIKKHGKLLLAGTAVGTKIGIGKIKIIKDPKRISDFRPGEILVSKITDPDWEPIMKIASGIITNEGGRTSHAAIVSRELGIPCIVGTEKATKILKNGLPVTIDCSSGDIGRIYLGKSKYQIIEHHLDKLPQTRTHIMVNIGSPEEAFKNHHLPVKGVGLGRLEFIIASQIRIHPNALIDFQKLQSQSLKKRIDDSTKGYKNKKQYYVRELAAGMAKIAAAFWPNEVIIRFSDFKTNEYKKLLGGEAYEPNEENPMIGWRGASRYYDPKFAQAFKLECEAVKVARLEMGLTNISVMVPFCRTVEEGQKVLKLIDESGLRQNRRLRPKIYVMCEIPSNILLADGFLKIFDGMSIGSNDLTQLTLGLDRDSGIVNKIANENNPAVMKLIAEIILKCRQQKKYIGICGQAPSDYPKFVEFLIKHKIDSMSLNPDTVIKTLLSVAKYEKKR